MPAYNFMVHLHCRSWYSFLAGASSPEALVAAAMEHGHEAVALTDLHSLAGAVQFTRACRAAGIKPIHGATVCVEGYPLVLLAADCAGYANLCDLISLAQAQEAEPNIGLEALQAHSEGLICLTGGRDGKLAQQILFNAWRPAQEWAQNLAAMFPGRCFIELSHSQRPGDSALIRHLNDLAATLQLPTVATNAVRHVARDDYALYDALTCARHGISVGDRHRERPVNAAPWFCSASTLRARGLPREAIANTEVVAALCDVDLLPGQVTPPQAHLPPGTAPVDYLKDLCRQGMKRRYPRAGKSRDGAVQVLRKEVEVITALELEEFFLVVREVVEFARSRGIRCSGRGSAANSIVAYLLGITHVDPIRHHLLFERFLHTGRKGMPDIDVDFETHRRHEVIAWMETRFGAAHTAMTANIITFRLRLAVREMGKVLGYPLWQLDQLGKQLPHESVRHVREHRPIMAEMLGDSPMLDALIALVERLHDGYATCPRHLSLHSGGMILSRAPLRTLSPIQTSRNGVRQVQFNKDDVEALGLIKFDVLGLRTLSVITEAQTLLHERGREVDVEDLPPQDQKTFQLIRGGHTLGVFQIESAGQWNLLSRSQPETFDDLVAQVALFRPGPLQGNMVHPYISRRRGLQPTTYPHPSLERVLRDTYGIILFQEQVLEVAHVFAGLSLSEADEFRRLMSKFRSSTEMENMRAKFVENAIATHAKTKHPVSSEVANHVFDLVSKFVGYGFCRSHAAAFARTVYQSAYLKAHYPAAYMAAVLEHKPSFWPLQTQMEEAKHFGVKLLPVCIERSDVRYRLEDDDRGRDAIRLPFMQVKGMNLEDAVALVLERATASFRGLEDLYRRVSLTRDVWDNLARAGALDALLPESRNPRREALWQLGALAQRIGPSGGDQRGLDEAAFPIDLPELGRLGQAEQTRWDYRSQGITPGPHPLSLHRPYLERLGARSIGELSGTPLHNRVMVAGAVISRQKPPTAKGMVFLILEDETGRLPTAVTPPVWEKLHRTLKNSGLVIEGVLEGAGTGQVGNYRSVLIHRAWNLDRIVGGYDTRRPYW